MLRNQEVFAIIASKKVICPESALPRSSHLMEEEETEEEETETTLENKASPKKMNQHHGVKKRIRTISRLLQSHQHGVAMLL